MTVLTQAIAIGDNEIHIDSALAAGQVPGFVKIDDELLNVGGQDNLAGKTLTLSTPAKEAHDNGATVTYAGRPFDPTFKTALTALAGDGGEQTVRLLGPFAIAYNSPGIDGGLALGTAGMIPEGATIVRTWVIATTGFLATGEVTLEIDSAPDSENYNGYPLVRYTGNLGKQGNASNVQEIATATTVDNFVVNMLESGRLMAYLTATDPTAGAGDVYALIAEPAA